MKKSEAIPVQNDKIIVTPLEKVLPSSMLPYAEFVILERALPRVEDGLKPVQRRILYTMYEMGLTPDKPHKKSARIVGDCMGKYHPHGDSSVYDAMVRMAQDFNMGMTLVNGHGNFGSVDGDPAAAMRYTEARLEPLALELLRDLEKNTVPFSLNFDDSLREPDVLPGRFPNLLVNGAMGIAVGLATSIPPHNLGEVIDGVIAFIDNPRISLENMMKYIPAPDFPTGGKIVGGEIEQAYRTGKGKIVIRAKASFQLADGERPAADDDPNAKRMLVITELPYQVNKAELLKKIVQLRDQRPELACITRVVDESDRAGMRAVIEMRGSKEDASRVEEILYKTTGLESNFNVNLVAIAKGKPVQMGLIDAIRYYVDHQRDVVLRRTKYDLAQAKERCHILEGLIIAVRNIDEVIRIIKTAESTPDARDKLRKRFELSEKQAQAILDLRLARLTKLEVFKLEEELKQLKELIERLTAVVGSVKLQLDIVKEELSAVRKKYAVPRKTLIATSEEEMRAERNDVYVPGQPAYFCITADGKIKCILRRGYEQANRAVSPSLRKPSVLVYKQEVLSDDELLVFTDLGNCCRVRAKDCMRRYTEAGVKLSDVAECGKGERPVAAFVSDDAVSGGKTLLFITAKGMLKKTELGEYSVNKAQFQAISLGDGDRVLSVSEDAGTDATVFFVTRGGQCLNAKKDDIPLQKRVSQGVRGMSLRDGDEVLTAQQVEDFGEFIFVTAKGRYRRVIVSQVDPLGRNCKGIRIAERDDTVIFADYVTEPYSLAVFTEDGVEELSTDAIPITAPDRHTATVKGIKWRAKEIFALKP